MRKLKPTKKVKKSEQDKKPSLKISACYITKNEEANLKRSLASFQGQVDEIVVVDTGSTDNTIAVAESFGAKVLTTTWNNDFATPRNMALENATGDWVLFLDADEYFPKDLAKNIRPLVKRTIELKRNGILINLINIDADSNNRVLDTTYLLRLFKKTEGIHYVGRIHEELRAANGDPIDNIVSCPDESLVIYHTGYSRKINADKARRNLKMLLAELEVTDNPRRIYGYIAQCYNGLGDYANAEKYAVLDIEAGRKDTTFASSSYRILLNIIVRAGRRADRLKYTERAVKDFPETPEFHAEYAECLAIERRYSEAIEQMEKALKLFKSYHEIEPMMFNNKMEEVAKQRIALWKNAMAKQ